MATKIEIAEVPGVGGVVCTVQETVRADGTVHVRVLQDARYTVDRRPVEDEHRDTVAAFINAM